MNYSYSQISSQRKIFPGSPRAVLLFWVLLLIPILIPQIFIPFAVVLAGILIYDLYENPHYGGSLKNISYDINWPDFLELNRPQKIDITWENLPLNAHLRILFPKEYSPRVVRLNQHNDFFKVRGKKKGTYNDIDIYIGVKSSLGFFTYYHRVLHKRTLFVAPPILYLSLKYFQNKENIMNRNYLGIGSEFHALRQYQRGDPLKRINWKKTAANPNEVYVNEYQKEQNQKVLIVMNTGIASRFEYLDYPYLDYQTALAFQLARTFTENCDETGLLTFSNQIDIYIPPDLSHRQLPFIFRSLQQVGESYEHMNLIDLYIFLKGKLQRKSILILLSPFLSFQQVYIQRQTIHLLSQNYQVIWVNPLRIFDSYYNQIKELSYLWAKVHILHEKEEEKIFFQSNQLPYVHERPEQLYQHVLKHYSSLKW